VTASGQETKLTKVETSVLDVIARAGWPEFTVQQLQRVTGRSSSSIRKVLHDYVSKDYTYSELQRSARTSTPSGRRAGRAGLKTTRMDTGVTPRHYEESPCHHDRGANYGDGGDQTEESNAERRERAERVRTNSALLMRAGSDRTRRNRALYILRSGIVWIQSNRSAGLVLYMFLCV